MDKTARLYKTVTYELKAHHRLISNRLSEEENQRIYQKCMGLHGHGHNYKIRVTYVLSVEGSDFLSGFSDLERQIKNLIIEPFQYQSLNEAFSRLGLDNPVTSGEQIVSVFSALIVKAGLNSYIHRLEVHETHKNVFVLSPDQPFAN